MNKLVSIIIPAYNTGKYIANAIESVVNQTYDNIEIIIVDDGSTDDTLEKAQSLLSSQSRPYLICPKENGGVSSARNYGLRMAKGEWVLFLDSDDFLSINMIETLVCEAEKYNSQCAFCDYKAAYEGKFNVNSIYNKGSSLLNRDELKTNYLKRKFQMVIPSTLIQKDVAESLYFDEQCPYSEDTLYTWELIFKIDSAVYVQSDMYNYFIRNGSKQHSLTPEKCIESIKRYHITTQRLMKEHGNDSFFIELIEPKFILGAFHILARCVDFQHFRSTRKLIQKKDIYKLFFKSDIRLGIYAILFCIFPRMFYKLSNAL